jgi:hypothetical protein
MQPVPIFNWLAIITSESAYYIAKRFLAEESPQRSFPSDDDSTSDWEFVINQWRAVEHQDEGKLMRTMNKMSPFFQCIFGTVITRRKAGMQ